MRAAFVDQFDGRSPCKLGQEEMRAFLAVLEGRGLSPQRIRQYLAALKFLYGRTLGRPEEVAWITFPRVKRRTPMKIRHYGLLAGSNVRTQLEAARQLLRPAVATHPGPLATSWIEILLALAGRDIRCCDLCDGPVVMAPLPSPPSPTARAPPA